MSEVKYTPGPWVGGPAATVLGADGRRVCQLAVRIDETELADGLLVIAAPDLLRALENLANAASATKGFASPMFLKDARAAIAKAKGETA